MLGLYLPALVVAVVITIIELTEVVALVFAISADAETLRPGAFGATAGVATVGVAALALGSTLLLFPRMDLLWGSAILLGAFGIWLFRSTLRAYRRRSSAAPPASRSRDALQFGGGFSVGAVEALEVVIVLLALAAAGYGFSALIGAVIGGAALVVAAAILHERIRRIKVPWLKWGATSALFAFAVFWAGEAAGLPWPGGDLLLLPLFIAAALLVRGSIALAGPAKVPVGTKS